jgi:hypothetical protein
MLKIIWADKIINEELNKRVKAKKIDIWNQEQYN